MNNRITYITPIASIILPVGIRSMNEISFHYHLAVKGRCRFSFFLSSNDSANILLNCPRFWYSITKLLFGSLWSRECWVINVVPLNITRPKNALHTCTFFMHSFPVPFPLFRLLLFRQDWLSVPRFCHTWWIVEERCIMRVTNYDHWTNKKCSTIQSSQF